MPRFKRETTERELDGYRAYVYGCLPPIAGEQAAIDAMHTRRRYWNALVALERDHREKVEAVIREVCPLEDEPTTDEERAAARAARKAAFARPDVKARLKDLEAERHAAVKVLRPEGMYWCHYDDVETCYEAARRKPGELRFQGWQTDTRQRVSVRYQRGLPQAEAFGDDTRLRIAPVDLEALVSPVRAARRKASRTTVSIRVGSDAKRQPVWLTLPLVLDRPLPPEARIRTATVIREKVGLRWRWMLVLTVAERARHTPTGSGVVALDAGWRKTEAGIRVMYGVGDDGRHWELLLPESWWALMRRVDDLRSIRDDNVNRLRPALLERIDAMWWRPDWLAEERRYMGQWKAADRFARLADRWKAERFEGDAEAFDVLAAWFTRERHLLSYEANLRDQLLAQRRDWYRVFAGRLARRYAEIRVPKLGLKQAAERSKGEDKLPDPVRRQRTLACLSSLRMILEHACGRHGAAFVEVDAKGLTRTCHACGAVSAFDAVKYLVNECHVCGARWDQDRNAAENMLSQKGGVLEQEGGLRSEPMGSAEAVV